MVKRGGKSAVSKADKRRWKIGSAIIIVLFSVIVGFLLWLSYTGSSKEIVAVADQFKPDPSWQLKSEAIEPPRTFCIDIECPSVWRQWQTNSLLSQEDFSKIIKKTNWDLSLDEGCDFSNIQNGENTKVCSAMGLVDGYTTTLTIRTTGTDKKHSIGLSIWKD